MMRGITVELPEAARAKLTAIELQRDGALDSMRGAAGRLLSLPRDTDAAKSLRERLEIERDRFAEKHRQLALLCSRVNQWAFELRLPAGAVLEVAPVPELRLKASETCQSALASVRLQITGAQQEIAAVRRAPLKRASQLEAVRAHLQRVAQGAAPKINFDVRGNAVVSWVEDLIVSRNDLMGILTWVLGAEAIATAFTRQLEEEPEAPGALSPLEREKRISELSMSLLSLERVEEALVERGGREGFEFARRADASPVAVLGVVIVAREAAAA
jgi:hypothetical protein